MDSVSILKKLAGLLFGAALFLQVFSAESAEHDKATTNAPQPGQELSVAEIDALKWDNLRLKMESMQLRAQMSRMQLDAEQGALQAEWQRMDSEWTTKYSVGLKQVRREGEKWIIQDPERKP